MRAEQHEHGANPAVQRPRRESMVDDEAIQHLNDLLGRIPGFRRDPAVGGEQTGRVAVAVHRDGDQMRKRLIPLRPRIGGGICDGSSSGRHAFGAQKSVEVTMLADFAAMRVVVILRMGFAVIHIVIGVVIEFVKRLALVQGVAQYFADQIQFGFLQCAVAVQNFLPGALHGLQLRPRKSGQRKSHRFLNGTGGDLLRCYHFLAAQGFLAPQGFFAAHGFIAPHGFLAAQGFFAAHGFMCLASFFIFLAAHGFLPAQGFICCAAQGFLAAQGLCAAQGLASAGPLMASASAPETSRDLVI